MASSRESPRRRAMQRATNRGTDDEDEDRGYVWLCEPVAPPLERESVAGGDRGVEPTVFVWIVASYIVVYIVDYVSTWCNCNHRRERVRLVRSEDDRDRYRMTKCTRSKGATRSSLTINTIQGARAVVRVQIGLGGERSVLGCRYTGIVILTSLPRTERQTHRQLQYTAPHSCTELESAHKTKNKSRYLGYEALPLGSAVVRYPCATSFFRGIIIMASHSAHTPRG